MGFMDFLKSTAKGAANGLMKLENEAVETQRRHIRNLTDAQLRHVATHTDNRITRELCEEEKERRGL